MRLSKLCGIHLNRLGRGTLHVSIVLWQAGLTAATKCLRDDELGDSYEANVYYCEEEDKPECCEVDHEATCCEKNTGKSFREQFQLWGILGVAIVLIAFVVVCWRKDTYLCEGDTLKERCRNSCRKRRKSRDNEDDSMELKVNRAQTLPEKKYTPPMPGSAMSKSENTSLTAGNTDHMITSHSEIQVSDVDSGRGSVASSASQLARTNEKTLEPVGNSLNGTGGVNIMLVQPTRQEQPELKDTGDDKPTRKHKSKKKSKSKEKELDSDENDEDYKRREKKSSKKKKKKSKSRNASHEDEDIEMDISNV